MIHVEKVELDVYCDIKAEIVVCTQRCTHKRGPKCCVQIPALTFLEKY